MLFLDKKKIDGDKYNSPPLTLGQVRKANPNISIPELTVKKPIQLRDVASELGYEICDSVTIDDFSDLIGDTFKEKKLVLLSASKKDGKWTRNYKAERMSGGSLRENKARLREKRNRLLQDSDWTQYADSPLSDKQKAEWKTYRQALRDLPKNYDHPVYCKFPTSPSE